MRYRKVGGQGKVGEEGDGAVKTSGRMRRFKCWWCERTLPVDGHHHEQEGSDGKTRHCCRACHRDPDSNYRRTYPGGVSQERREVRHASARLRRDR